MKGIKKYLISAIKDMLNDKELITNLMDKGISVLNDQEVRSKLMGVLEEQLNSPEIKSFLSRLLDSQIKDIIYGNLVGKDADHMELASYDSDILERLTSLEELFLTLNDYIMVDDEND